MRGAAAAAPPAGEGAVEVVGWEGVGWECGCDCLERSLLKKPRKPDLPPPGASSVLVGGFASVAVAVAEAGVAAAAVDGAASTTVATTGPNTAGALKPSIFGSLSSCNCATFSGSPLDVATTGALTTLSAIAMGSSFVAPAVLPTRPVGEATPLSSSSRSQSSEEDSLLVSILVMWRSRSGRPAAEKRETVGVRMSVPSWISLASAVSSAPSAETTEVVPSLTTTSGSSGPSCGVEGDATTAPATAVAMPAATGTAVVLLASTAAGVAAVFLLR